MLESMALGVPMIAPRLGGMAEAIIPGRTGYLFSVGDLADLERCMHEVVSDPGNAATLGGAAAEMVAERFTRSQMVTRTESLLDEVLSRQS
jgi:glycosyltransferase involved in cell wall biosynthesis